MGECPPSNAYHYDDVDGRGAVRSTLTVEFWDEGYPYPQDDPRVNVTAEDHERDFVATSGLRYEQAEALHHALGRWLASPRKEHDR